MAALLAATLVQFPASAEASPTPDAAPAGETIGGIQWSDVVRVTDDPGWDRHPEIHVSENRSATVFWTANRSGDDGYWFSRVNVSGQVEEAATFLSPHVSSYGRPRGSQLGVDSQGDIHFVREEGFPFYNISYAKFGLDGTAIVPEKRLGPNDTIRSYGPSLAVRGDDEVWIVHTEDVNTTLDAVSVDGQELWTNRPVHTQQVVPPFPPPLPALTWLRYDRLAESLLLSYTDGYSSWLMRYNETGAMDLPQPVNLWTTPSFIVVPEVAATPDRTMHAVWERAGALFYDAVATNGTLLVNGSQITGPRNPDSVRVAGLNDGRAIIVWSEYDSTEARFRVKFTFSTPDGTGGWTFSESHYLTDDAGNATQPWVTTAPDGTLYVAWVSDETGDPEVYYAHSRPCGFEFRYDPTDYAAAFSMRLGQSRVINLTVRNTGVVPVDLNLTYELPVPAQGAGWSVSLGAGSLTDVLPGQGANTTVTITAPPDGADGANASYAVRATDNCPIPRERELVFHHIVRVTRGLTLEGPPNLGPVPPGSEWPFSVALENTGEVEETGVTIVADSGILQSGVTVQPDRHIVNLTAGERLDVNFTLLVAPNAPGVGPSTLRLRAWTADSYVSTGAVFFAFEVETRFWLNVTLSESVVVVAPGSGATVPFTVKSFGNLYRDAEVNLSMTGVGSFSGWSATLDRTVLQMDSGLQETVWFFRTVPSSALAGESSTYCLVAEADEFSANASACVEVVVAAVHSPDVLVDSVALSVKPGRQAGFSIPLINRANAPDVVNASIERLPSGWTAEFNDSGTSAFSLLMQPGDRPEIGVAVGVSEAALAGDYRFDIRVAFASGREFVVPITVTVEPWFAVEISVAQNRTTARPGSNATFYLTVTNTGNSADLVRLNTLDLLPDFGWSFFLAGEVPVLLGNSSWTSVPILLEPGETALVELRVAYPHMGTGLHMEFSAWAESSGQEGAGVILMIDRQAPDLRPSDLVWTPTVPVAGEMVQVMFRVANIGSYPSGEGMAVEVFDGNTSVAREMLPPIAAGGWVEISIQWTPNEWGIRPLSVWVDTGGAMGSFGSPSYLDLNETNNAIRSDVEVSAPPETGLPSVGPLAVAVAFMVVALADRRRRLAEIRK